MAKIAAVLAYDRVNCGMYSVDLSAIEFFGRIGLDVNLFCPLNNPESEEHRQKSMGVQYLSDASQLDSYDCVVYWGDFTTNLHYGTRGYSFREQKFGVAKSEQEAFANWAAKHIGKKPAGQVCVSVSQNFQTLIDGQIKSMPDYPQMFADRFDYVFPRDPVSLQAITALMPDDWSGKAAQGIDIAHLVSSIRKDSFPSNIKTQGYFACFFHRSGLKNVGNVIASVSKATGLLPVYLDRWLKAPESASEDIYNRNIAVIKQAEFLISDTYHVCVNGMNCRVPVVGVGKDQKRMTGTVGDFKKQTLFEMHGIGDNYLKVTGDRVGNRDLDKLVEIINRATDGSWPKRIEQLTQQRSDYEELLKNTFLGIAGQSTTKA